jgi:glycogen debranching enzyme
MPDILELEGRSFVAAEEIGIPEWTAANTKRLQPTLTLKDDDLFIITDPLGNISDYGEEDGTTSLGLFCRDTRFLSRLELQIEGRSPVLLSSTAQRGFALSALCANPQIEGKLTAETIGIHREMVINGALFEDLKITNYSREAVAFEMSLSFGADFADLFNIRGFVREHKGKILRHVPIGEDDPDFVTLQMHALDTGELTLAYQGLDGAVVESRVQFSNRQPDMYKGYTAIWRLELASHESIHLGYRLLPMVSGRPASVVSAPMTLKQAIAAESMEESDWKTSATRINSDNRTFNQVLDRAEQDIYLLRQSFGKGKVLAAGIPWYSTLFGRDSIIAAMQTLMLDPLIARETLQTLAYYQGRVDDEWRDEQPGKILHELRMGEMARCNEVPHTPYYGTVDATPLWLMLYADYYNWTHDSETLEQLWDNALRAMEWIDRAMHGVGYLSYYRKSSRGLQNQGWKDSEDCIVYRNGELAEGSIALSEVQGYVYAAKVQMSAIARMKKRIDLAERWEEEARSLQARFNRDFWIEDQGYCAIALDGDNRPVDGISSNPGHCLSTGILHPEKARSVAERLQAPDMFNGWGIRTLSSLSPAYNPMGYHIGSVWPHENAMIAMGLRSLGLIDQALEVAQGIVDMTLQQPYQRPPELFCGYERTPESSPVRYPVACSPQAWATGAIFQFLQSMVNLVPDAPSNCLRIIDPALPESVHRLSLHNLRIGQTVLDLDFERVGGTTACRVTKKRGNLRVIIEA